MHANYQLLKKQILEERESITDEELFTSNAYADYQSGIAESASKRYKTGVQVLMNWDTSPDAPVAFTDNHTIHENAGNDITISFPTRLLRSQSLTGLTGHECGHLLFTDFTARNLYLTSMENGCFYPADPSICISQYQFQFNEIQDAMNAKKKTICQTLAKCAASLTNIFEDIYIEARMCQVFPGSFKLGININSQRMAELSPSIQAQIDKEYMEWAIMSNLILQYCRAGDVNNPTNYQGEYLDCLEECIPVFENSLYATNPKKRFEAVNELLVILWPYIKPLVKQAEEAESNGKGEEFLDQLTESLGAEMPGATPLPNGKGKPKLKNSGKISPGSIKKGKAQAQKVVKEETGRIARAKTSQLSTGTNPGVSYNFSYKGSDYEDSANDILNVLTKLASERANASYEEELSEELQQEATKLQYGNIHKGIHICVNRIRAVNPFLIASYNAVKAPLLEISKRLQSNVKEILDKKRNGEKLSHLIYGKRLEARCLYQNDGAYFSRTKLPGEPSELAVGLLVDESGSMSSDSRITMARQAAIILYDFCSSLDIPITIYGHTEDSDVELYSYAEFDSLDKNDCYRLMDISARACNRDGAALRYVAAHLDARPEDLKILIIISDGQPSGEGYYGTAAEADLRAIKQEYRKKGVLVFAAAIGSDKDRIKEIYQDGFLDISDLNKLPRLLPKLIEQYIQ
ncbi:MAG: nitric oxide reductase activation protein NorD [Hespellia sp.]|nr:nitric oxide reductase activation protein NorD [Hespellia sp.]